jgi:phage terminase large subunit GpA-like protein
MNRALEIRQEGRRAAWTPPPLLTVSEWADDHRVLSSEASAEPGQWRTSRVPYMRAIMDALSPSDPTERIVVMKGAQLGGTEAILNALGYLIHLAPGPALLVQPTVEVAQRFSKQRLTPMIEATPVLREQVREARSRDSGNTILVKQFPGGLVIITGANSAAGLRSMPIRYLECDEVDEYPGDVEGQGDPISLAEKRTSTFANRKVLLVSTPTVKGLSRIEAEFAGSDQRHFYVCCPFCGHWDWIRWPQIRWDEDRPETAHLVCAECQGVIEERMKGELLLRGEWRPTTRGDGHTAGFHLSGLYSPLGWVSWERIVREFLKADAAAKRGDLALLKSWVNARLGETWEERGETVEPDAILARTERYSAEVPNGVGLLVASVDVQGDRLEAQVTGFGAGEESWLIAWQQFPGDPASDRLWWELDRFLNQTFTHESGQKVRVSCTAVDSGGHHSEQVYRFCKTRLGRRVFAIRGGSERGKPVVDRPTRHNVYHTPLYTLCVDTAKETVCARLKIASPGPGYMHLPGWIDAEYVEQLTAEKKIRKYVKGKGSVPEWVKTRERNEALDLTVYSLAALYILGPVALKSLPERAAQLARPAAEVPPPSAPDPYTSRAPFLQLRRRGWVTGWRDW